VLAWRLNSEQVQPKRKVSPSKHSAEFSAVVTEPKQAPAPVPSVASLHLDMSKLPRIVLLASIAFAILFVAFQGLVSLASILLLASCCMHAGAASTLPGSVSGLESFARPIVTPDGHHMCPPHVRRFVIHQIRARCCPGHWTSQLGGQCRRRWRQQQTAQQRGCHCLSDW